eukprot:scaffold1849_cov107-Isochrysis_galbana.AAC.12
MTCSGGICGREIEASRDGRAPAPLTLAPTLAPAAPRQGHGRAAARLTKHPPRLWARPPPERRAAPSGQGAPGSERAAPSAGPAGT